MSPYDLASELLGHMPLTNWQVAELRAIDRKYQQRLYTLLHRDDAAAPRAEQALTEEEVEELRARVVSDILAMLTPEQRALVAARATAR